MKIEIDQSGKIENTNHDTIIAFSNGVFGSIMVSAKDKREVQKVFRKTGKNSIFIYRLFAILIFLLIKKHIKKIRHITIDTEYPGRSAMIKDFLMREIKKTNSDIHRDDIIFAQVGKRSKAHYLAYGVATRKKQPDMVAGVKEILKFIVK